MYKIKLSFITIWRHFWNYYLFGKKNKTVISQLQVFRFSLTKYLQKKQNKQTNKPHFITSFLLSSLEIHWSVLVITEYYSLKKNRPCFKSHFIFLAVLLFYYKCSETCSHMQSVTNRKPDFLWLVPVMTWIRRAKNCITNKWRGMYFQRSFRFLENQVQITLDERIRKTGVLECETKRYPGFHKVKKVF